MKNKKNKKALTIAELLLAIAIGSLVFTVLLKTMSYGMRVYRYANGQIEVDVMRFVTQLKEHLHSAYLFDSKDSSFRFEGRRNSIRFVSASSLTDVFENKNDYDLKERKYYLSADRQTGASVVKHSFRNLSTKNGVKEKFQDRIMATMVWSVQFAYFNGDKWSEVFSSTEEFPQAVRVTIDFYQTKEKKSYETFSTIIDIPSALNETNKE